MDFADLANRAGPDNFAKLAVAHTGMALVTHLRGDLIFAGGVGEFACFPNRVRQRLLAINVFAMFIASIAAG